MAREYQGGCSSAIFAKDIDNMMPFTTNSAWNFASIDGISKRTSQPIVTGTSVLGIAYNKGVLLCADTLGAYGSMTRFLDCRRILKVNDQTIIGAGGDIADFQYLSSVIEQQVIDEECLNDGFNLKPKSLHCWLTRTLYNRRSKFEPLWNVFAVGGMQDGVPFLGIVDKIGTSFQSQSVATGFGSYLAQPILRDAVEKNPNLTETEALDLLKHCMRILYYRDSRSFPRYTLAKVDQNGATVEGPFEIDSDWTVGLGIVGYE